VSKIKTSQLLSFFRTDIVWVAIGQLSALVIGLITLKIFTSIFTAEEYSYIALLMALSGWIWMAIYQPLNQSIFRFYSIAEKENWLSQFKAMIIHFEIKLFRWIVFVMLITIGLGLVIGVSKDTIWLLFLAGLFGLTFGCIHGMVSYFMGQRRRKPVTFIQGTEGLFRLTAALIAYYAFSQSVVSVATGIVCGGLLFLGIVYSLFLRGRLVVASTVENNIENERNLLRYAKKMLLILVLNASVVHLDKWLLYFLLGGDALGKYAVMYFLAMTVTSVLYVFFEMVVFPLIFQDQNVESQNKKINVMLSAYVVSISFIILISYYFGEFILTLMTSPSFADEFDILWVLVLACGLLQFGRLLMVKGQIEIDPARYWPAYLALFLFFITWCGLFVSMGGVNEASVGFAYATGLFSLIVLFINKGKRSSVQISNG